MPPILLENVRWRLKQIHSGHIFDINTTDNYMVGRSKTAQIILNSNKISRTHSSFVVNIEGHLLVQDLNSANGTYINGTQISVYILRRLSPGDTIAFGMADIESAENDRDRHAFFVVIQEVPPVQIVPPIEANFADSTTDLRGNIEGNSTGGNQSFIRNSTAELVINSFTEFPSSSTKKEDPLDIIEILSSICDDEKPDVDDLNDFLEVENEEPNFQVADIGLVPEKPPERQKIIANVDKPASSRKSAESNNNNLITTKQVMDFFKSSEDKGKERNQDSVPKKISERTGNKARGSNNHVIDSPCISNHGDKKTKEGLNDTQTTPNESTSKNIYLESSIIVNKSAAKNPSDVLVGRKSLAELDPEIRTDNRYSKTDKDFLRQNTLSEEARLLQKSKVESHLTVTDLKTKEAVMVPTRRKSLASDLGRKDTEYTRNKTKDTAGQKDISKDSTTLKQGCKVPQTKNSRTTNLQAKNPAGTGVRRKSLPVTNPEDEDNSRKKSKNSSRRKSLYAEPRSSKSEVESNQKKDKSLEDELVKRNIESAKNSEAREKSKNSVPVSSKRKSFKTSDTEAPGKKSNECRSESPSTRKNLTEDLSSNKDNGPKSKDPVPVCSRRTSVKTLDIQVPRKRSDERSSERKSFAGDSSNKNKFSEAKNDMEITKKSSEKESVHIHEKKSTYPTEPSRRSSMANDEKIHNNKRKSSIDDSLKNTKRDKYNDDGDDLLMQLERAIYGSDRLSPPKVAPISDLSKSDAINQKCDKKQKNPEEKRSKCELLQNHKQKSDAGNCGLLPLKVVPSIEKISDIDKSNEEYTKCKKKSTVPEETVSKPVGLGHKKVIIDDCDEEFIFNRVRTPREEETREDSLAEEVISSKSTEGNNTSKDTKKDNHITDKSNNSGENFTSFREPTARNISVLETTFTTDKDNSVIIDITDDNDDYDDMDFSCSQIFHMSQIAKTEVQDDTFQKIKNELAEMEFCEEETIINPVPINLEENEMSGFENTQDICAYLEGSEKHNDDNIISNEENEELLQILGDFDQDNASKDHTSDVQDMDTTLCESSKEDTSLTKIECSAFFGKSKYEKPPVIEPHTISKPRKELPKASPSNKDTVVNKESKSNKRKNSLEVPSKKKKLKGSPKCVAEPPRCDSKSIHIEFKKRNSTSKLEQDKLRKDHIREERRKKLKEITERRSLPEVTESKVIKGKTVKVLPDYKTRRGTFLCEELKKNDNVKSKVQNKSPVGLRDSVASELSYQKNNTLCKCRKPGTSGQQLECAVHTRNLCNDDPNRENLNKRPDNISPNVRTPRRSKTPTNELNNYNLKSIDLPESTSKYNLRRTRSSGDIKADLAKANDQLRPVQTRYNFRHSTTMDYNRNGAIQDGFQNLMEHDIRQSGPFVRHTAAPYPVDASAKPTYANQAPQYAMRPKPNQMDTMQSAPHHLVSRPTNDLSRKLMWGNGGASIKRRPPVRRLPSVDEVIQKMVNWLPNWLTEQVNIDSSAPVNSPPARKIPLNFKNYDQYYNIFSKLVLLENWQYLFKGFREGAEQPRKVKVEHVRVANDLMTIDCISYVTQKELRQGLFYKAEDFVLLECVMNDQSNSYISLSFGFIQRCKKTIISNDDVISIRPDMRYVGSYCAGVPHTKLEFSIITRHQQGKEINTKKFPIVKLLANIRAHLMMIRAVKGLAKSPVCSKILYPKINEYKIAVAYRDIIQPHSLNTQQRTIVLEAASLCTGTGHGLYCIKGPPGTGKSTVIVNLVFQILFSHYVTKKTKEPPMILLAAPSNTAVDNLLAKLTDFKHRLPAIWDKYKAQIKCVRIGPESSISKELIGYSLPKLAEKHMPIKHMEVPEFKAARDRNENLHEFSKTFFGDRYGYEIKACEDLIIEKSNIICTTLNSCINGKLIEAVNRGLIKFSCCIIDEATQCHEVEALLPTILGIDKFVLVGDPKQLNATIMNRDAAKLGFGESLFSRISNNFTNDPRTPIKMLTDQYRMHPEICAFPNKHFYEGKLKSVPNPPNKLPEKIKPYLVFNCEKINDSCDYTNIDEVNLMKKLLSTIFGMIDKNHKYTVGIITPYNAQKDLIGSNIQDLISKNGNCKITVNTVDSFQGSENDIIVISCVRDSTNSFLQNENRLNVALTRAKQALYIIGNYTLFKECRTLYDLREDAKKRKLLLDIRQDPKTIDNFSKYLLKKNLKK